MANQQEFISTCVQKPYNLTPFNSLTNYVYLVTTDTDKLIYRKYSDFFSIFQNREQELQLTLQLSQLNLAPHVLKSDKHQRLEQYLPYENTNLKEMKEQYLPIAQLIASFHKKTQTPQIRSICNPNQPIIKTHLTNHNLKQCVMEVLENQTQTDLKTKKKIISTFQNVFSQQVQSKLFDLLQSPCFEKLELILAHNDLNSTNFLKDADGNFHLIDFEYTGFNYPGYEIANFFNEMEWDYTYQKKPYFEVSEELGFTDEQKQQFLQRYWSTYTGNQDEQVPEALFQQIEIGSILQNYFWLLIGALSLQFKEKTIDLDQYIKKRIQNLNKIFL